QLTSKLIGPYAAYAQKQPRMQPQVNAIAPRLRSGEIWRNCASCSRGKYASASTSIASSCEQAQLRAQRVAAPQLSAQAVVATHRRAQLAARVAAHDRFG